MMSNCVLLLGLCFVVCCIQFPTVTLGFFIPYHNHYNYQQNSLIWTTPGSGATSITTRKTNIPCFAKDIPEEEEKEKEEEVIGGGILSEDEVEDDEGDEALLPPEDDDDCGDECEIDWDTMMPSWDDDDDDEEEEANEQEEKSNAENESNQEREESFSSSPSASATSSSYSTSVRHRTSRLPSLETRRLRLEMQWIVAESNEKKADECGVLSEPTACGGDMVCSDCNGKGYDHCRFCGGRTILRMGRTMFAGCPICQQGIESCPTCRGTGYIAPWAAVMGKSFSSNSDLKP